MACSVIRWIPLPVWDPWGASFHPIRASGVMETRQIVRTAGNLRQVAVIAVLALVLPGSAPAQANEFTINACQADRSEFSTRAFEDFANRGMLWRRACNPEGPGLRGLVTANVVRAGRVAQGSRSYFVMRAPEGTQFSRFTWSGQARRHETAFPRGENKIRLRGGQFETRGAGRPPRR